MDTPKISVIVPVYNVEQYLPRCIDSILAQTFTDFELLLIDDGSPDDSGKICDEYAERDTRIRVFHKENGGVSSARNLGLDNARGEWIAFVDADDWISNDFLIIENWLLHSDIVQKHYIRVVNGEFIKGNEYKMELNSKKSLYYFLANHRNNELWNKLISYKVIKNVRFDINIKIGEDLMFMLKIASNVNTYSFSNSGVYYYNVNDKSVMARINEDRNKKIKSIIHDINNLKRLSLEIKDSSFLINSILYRTYFQYLFSLRSFLNNDDMLVLKAMANELDVLHLKYINKTSKIKIVLKAIIVKLCQ